MKIKHSGFREYDARWLYPNDIDLNGLEELGKGLGTQVVKKTNKENPKIIVGHDYRSYSDEVKKALIKGLISTGCNVEDIVIMLKKRTRDLVFIDAAKKLPIITPITTNIP